MNGSPSAAAPRTAPGPDAPAVSPGTADRLFETAAKVADAVLYEGYVLYPYRASAAKNRMRWQFGVLAPPSWDGVGGESRAQRTECLVEPRGDALLHVRLRFLRVQRRTVEQPCPGGGFEPADRLDLPDRVLVPWDEGVEEQADVTAAVSALTGRGVEVPVWLPEGSDTEEVRDGSGAVAGRLVRRRERIDALLRLTAAEVPGPCRLLRLTAVVENTGACPADPSAGASREQMLPYALVSAHLMLGVDSGGFLSMADPPLWAAGAAAGCRSEHTWPVLAGREGRADVVLSSPIILEDHPRLAPESPGALYDALEIDEILTLRTATLTEEEKREARGTDARAGAVVDLADSMPPEVLERLHGAVRSLRAVTGEAPDGLAGAGSRGGFGGFGGLDEPPVLTTPGDEAAERAAEELMRPQAPWWDPAADASVDPERDRVLVDGTLVGAGDRVVLRPGRRRTDAQDMFLHGRTALVEAVLHDVDGSVHLAVVVDGDPGAELQRAQGRFRYFQPDEVALQEDT
ncbi:hypothetical protein [Actinacidiphila yeochonensis]|uniref:hypothetical protein n=1 Tax=Actinacidiphila yeochonensis TaxID=89050 RepID=UPI000691C7AA|nr:hypothetical protein [Actinacidiphila yeochonensis]